MADAPPTKLTPMSLGQDTVALDPAMTATPCAHTTRVVGSLKLDVWLRMTVRKPEDDDWVVAPAKSCTATMSSVLLTSAK